MKSLLSKLKHIVWTKRDTHTVLCFFWLLNVTFFFLYSYGFVDFNLTLSSHPAVLRFLSWTQKLAMFNRQLSFKIYIGLIIKIFLLYFITLRFYWHENFRQFPWKMVSFLALLFAFSYPFLSSDVFKYLFSGRMVINYHLNPHLVPPNHIQGDDWLRFLRWIHTPSPYGPVMTLQAIIFYLLGLMKFVPTLYLFKLSQVGWYLLAIYLIGKLDKHLGKDRPHTVFSQLLFALNPLILIEWLVNAHNDASMLTLLLLAIYLLMEHRRWASFLALIFSVGVKYVTIIFLPFIFLRRHLSPKFMIRTLLLLLALTPLIYRYSFQYQPWYVTWLIPLVALLPFNLVSQLVIAYSFGSLLRYLPFISTGLWGASAFIFALYSFAPPLLVLLIAISIPRWRKL